MIRGAVSRQLEPRLRLGFLDAADVPLYLDAEIDTAFAGFVALPADVVTHLGLPFVARYPVALADGTSAEHRCFLARVEWEGAIRTVQAFEMGTNPLVGINFLWNHRLTIDVNVGGDVTVEPLP